MKTEIKRDGNLFIVNLDGLLEFNTFIPLREKLEELIDRSKTDTTPTKFIFNLANLEFVGSSGISAFILALKEFSVATPTRPRYCNVKVEFKKIFNAFDEEKIFEFHDNEESAKRSFDQ